MSVPYNMVLATNKNALREYAIIDTYDAGIVLSGPEVKSVRNGQVNLKGSFVVLKSNRKKSELFLINAHISPYAFAQKTGSYDPSRSRKILITKKELNSIFGKTKQKGLTMAPIKMYTRGNRIKLEFAVVSGKTKYDKREDIKKRETDRIIRRNVKLHYR